MGKKNGVCRLIVQYVVEHPGVNRADLLEAFDLDMQNALPTYCENAGMIFSAGPRGWKRYYPTEAEAQAEHADLCAQVEERKRSKVKTNSTIGNLRRKARRHAAGAKSICSRPDWRRMMHLTAGVAPAANQEACEWENAA